MKLLIDGDACPVKDIVYQVAAVAGLRTILVTSFAHYSNRELPALVEVVYVDDGVDSADYRLLALAKKGDLVVTQDYGLASLLLPKGVAVLHHLGFEYTQGNISQMLENRFFSAKMRKGGQRTKGPKKLTEADKELFKTLLETKISKGAQR